MTLSSITPAQLSSYERDGYLLLRGLFESDEIDLLGRAAREDRVLDSKSFGRADGEGGSVRLSLWNDPPDNLYGMFARSERVVRSAEAVLGGPVGHYHSKMIMKDPRVGGTWAWHQDYGYWYDAGYLFPHLASMSIAIDPATRANGCLQVVPGSHRLGRINHTTTGEQAGADPDRVAEVLSRLQVVHCEMEPGDALLFHCNLLHRSDQNRSDNPRWSMICCYNAIGNDPTHDVLHKHYEPVQTVSGDAIRKMGLRRFAGNEQGVTWLDPNEHLDEASPETHPS